MYGDCLTNREDNCFRKALASLPERSLNPPTGRTLLVAHLVCWNATSIGTPRVEEQIAFARDGGAESAYVFICIPWQGTYVFDIAEAEAFWGSTMDSTSFVKVKSEFFGR
jgi:hypothetical protein